MLNLMDGGIMNSFLALIMFAAISAHADKVAAPSGQPPADVTPQAMGGFKSVEKTKVFEKFEFRDHGEFLISNEEFSTRQQALDFCKKHPDYELADWRLLGVMVMSGLHFDGLRKNAIID